MTYWPELYFGAPRSILEVAVEVDAESSGVIGVNATVEQVITVKVTAEESDIVALMEVEQ